MTILPGLILRSFKTFFCENHDLFNCYLCANDRFWGHSYLEEHFIGALNFYVNQHKNKRKIKNVNLIKKMIIADVKFLESYIITREFSKEKIICVVIETILQHFP